MFIYFWESVSESEWNRDRERGRQNPKQAPGSELSAQRLTQRLNSQAMTWAKVGHMTNWATRATLSFFYVNVYFSFWERERERAQEGSERERETQNLKQASDSEPASQSPTQGESPTSEWRHHDLSWSRTLTHWATQVSLSSFLIYILYFFSCFIALVWISSTMLKRNGERRWQ